MRSYDRQEVTMTAESLKGRGRCCKNSCLHCPYGFTIKKNGLEFDNFEASDSEKVQKRISDLDIVIDTESYNQNDYVLIFLKDVWIGLFRKDHIQIKELSLFPEYRNQEISKALIESYYY